MLKKRKKIRYRIQIQRHVGQMQIDGKKIDKLGSILQTRQNVKTRLKRLNIALYSLRTSYFDLHLNDGGADKKK